jgi:hypothetical protein
MFLYDYNEMKWNEMEWNEMEWNRERKRSVLYRRRTNTHNNRA